MSKVTMIGSLECQDGKADEMQQHGQSDAMKAAMEAFGPLAAGPPRMSMAKPVGAIGLEL